MIQQTLENPFVLFHAKRTVRIRNDSVCPSCIKSCHRRTILIRTDRKLGFVPIIKGLFHPHCRLHHPIEQFYGKPTDPVQIVSYFVLLERQLRLVIKRLYLTAAALAVVRAFRIDAVSGRPDDPHQPGIRIALFHFHHLRLDLIADHSVLHKKSKAVKFPDALAVNPHIINAQCYDVIFSVLQFDLPSIIAYFSRILTG